jgi:diguanylate cyclase (GGDEF)-like protein
VGRDEIAVLLPHLTAAEAAEAGRNVRTAVGALQVACGEEVLGITACVGVAAVAHLTDQMLSGLLYQAEAALRAAKQRGPGHVVCAWEC